MTRPFNATYAACVDTPAQQLGPDASTWITRGANFVVAISRVSPGACLTRLDQSDEYFVLLPDCPARVEWADEIVAAQAESVLIVPPGNSKVTATGAGLIVRVFSNRSTDLCSLAVNADQYATDNGGAAPLLPWPDPPAGFRLRHYRLADHSTAESNMRIFRSTNLMINMLAKRPVPRDPAKLSPHSHADFEQGSLAVQGTYVHHLRWPWGADRQSWKEDEHVEIGSPSLTVIPATVLHTSQNISDGDCWLIDIFSPPRLDFSLRPGLVRNGDEYPLPAQAPG